MIIQEDKRTERFAQGQALMATDQTTPLTSVEASQISAPPANQFPAYPVSWYLFCDSIALTNGPVSKAFLGRQIVAYRASTGQVVAMDARCSHLGSDLGQGQVLGDSIQCPFHDWQFGPDGHCTKIPAQDEIPKFARQVTYPAEERHGFVFIFSGPQPLFPLPFFPDCQPQDFVPARPFGTALDCPWYMAGANAFDLQHFRAAHDRRLKGDPVAKPAGPFAFQATGTFDVSGGSIRDRLTRQFAGDEVTLAITDWCGSLSFATAHFRRTTSYGMVAREPVEDGRVRVHVVVFVRQSRWRLGRMLLDPIRLAIRRYFIKKFLTEDAMRLDGVRYNRHGMIEADRDMIRYFQWLSEVSHGKPPPGEWGEPAGDPTARRLSNSTDHEPSNCSGAEPS